MGRECSVGIASRYGIDGPGSTPGRDEILRTRSDRPWSPPSLTYSAYPVILEGKAAGRDADHPPHLASKLKKG